MEWGSVLGQLGTVVPLLQKVWRRVRFGPRIRIELDWTYLPIYFPDAANPRWRAIAVIVTAGKDEEFVVAAGAVQVRTAGSGQWQDLNDLSRSLRSPAEVPKNRERAFRISGKTVGEEIRQRFGFVSPLELRVIVHDHHWTRLVSDPLKVDLNELEREELL